MDTFGEWLRQQRDDRRLTRADFAKRVGCSVALIRKLEDGERRPSAQIAELIASCLNIPHGERATFVKVARGESSIDRLAPISKTNTLSTNPHISLPVFPTPLIGRQHEVKELSRLLLNSQCRLLTLVGPGGIGKTRLAIEAVSSVLDAFADGVYFVHLAPVNAIRYIVPIIADVIGFSFESASLADPKSQLFSYLKEKQVIILLDSLEHLLAEPGIEILADLLANAPRVKLVTTSRESVGLQDEWIYEVQGLPIPEIDRAQESAQDTSVELFLQRARRANVGFNATPEDYPAIVRICQLVDGMPLGIELAAAWVRTLSCDEIAGEIERGKDFLKISARDLPVRHRSMRAVFDHSWKLLTAAEQEFLSRLAVFQGGFTHEAAAAVTGATLPVLSILMTKSLIRRTASGRFDLHELIRQYAAEKLANHPEGQKSTQSLHGRHYLTYFSQADIRLRSHTQHEVLAELTAEMDNFRVAWDWAVANGKFSLIEDTLRLLVVFYDTLGWFKEGIDSIGRAIEVLEMSHKHSPFSRMNQIALGHLLATRAWFTYRQANYEQAQKMLERSLEILRPLNEQRVMVESILFLGQVMDVTGNYTRALELYSEGLEIARQIGDRWFADLYRTVHTNLVGITDAMVEPEITYERMLSIVADWRTIGDPRLTAFSLNFLSQIALKLGRYDEARTALEENVALNSMVGFRWGLGTAYRGLGIIAQAQGEHTQAVNMFNKSLDTFTELGGSWWVARVMADLGRSVFSLGNYTEAERIWGESLRIATETRGTPVALEALSGFADLQAKKGNMEYALELMLIVLNHSASFHETKNRVAHLHSELEAQLTNPQVEAALAKAQTRPMDVVVDEVLKQANREAPVL